jgi:uncharacterized C2H2 Zn-finger protein
MRIDVMRCPICGEMFQKIEDDDEYYLRIGSDGIYYNTCTSCFDKIKENISKAVTTDEVYKLLKKIYSK